MVQQIERDNDVEATRQLVGLDVAGAEGDVVPRHVGEPARVAEALRVAVQADDLARAPALRLVAEVAEEAADIEDALPAELGREDHVRGGAPVGAGSGEPVGELDPLVGQAGRLQVADYVLPRVSRARHRSLPSHST